MSCCEWVPSGGGGGGGVGSRSVYVVPEIWGQENVPAGQASVPLVTEVSINFDTFKAIVAGSVTGISSRLTAAVAAGNLRVAVTVNGVVQALLVASTNVSNPSGGIATAVAGIVPYVAGDLLGVNITTDAGFLPNTTDIEVMLQVTE